MAIDSPEDTCRCVLLLHIRVGAGEIIGLLRVALKESKFDGLFDRDNVALWRHCNLDGADTVEVIDAPPDR